MITASEARKKTKDNISECVTKQLSEIMEQIEEAISDGNFSIANYGCLKPETRKKLEELGYEVKTGSQYNESYYSVSW